MLQRLAAGAWELAQLEAGAAGALRPATLYQRQADARWLTDAPLTASLSSSSASIEGTNANQASGLIHVAAAGGVGELSIVWGKVSGGAIAADNPAAFDTTFSAAGLAPGETRTAVFHATIADELAGELIVGPVELTFERWAVPVVDVQPGASASGPGTPLSTAAVTALLTGGTAPFFIGWSKRAGGGSIVADSPNSLTTTFSAANLAQGETRSATFDIIVVDANGLQASDAIGVSVSRLSALTVALSTTSLSSNVTTADATTAAVTASPAGGSGPYGHSWAHKSGDAIAADAPASETTSFTATGLVGGDAGETRSAVFVDTVTDHNGTTIDSADVTVTIARAASSPIFTPAAGTYDKSASVTVTYKLTASQVVRWDWSGTPTTGLSADVATGGSASSITFTLAAASSADRSSAVTVTATGADGSTKNFTLNLTAIAPATYSPAGGSSTTNGNGAVSKTITASRAVAWDWTRTSGVGTCNVATGGSASSITFSLASSTADRTTVFSVTATDAAGNVTTWTVTLNSYVAATYSPSPLTGSDTDSSAAGASYKITASRAVDWDWTRTGSTAGTSTPANHSNGTTMTLKLPQGTTNRTCTFTVTATDPGGAQKTFTITLTANAAPAVTFTPAAGTYSASGDDEAQYTITASASVVWTWSKTGIGVASVASGSSATSITFTVTAAAGDRTATFTVSAGGKSWTINLTAYYTGTTTRLQ
jgi:5-hydroxyisourate hydrolase-like protein (transthyretin family)